MKRLIRTFTRPLINRGATIKQQQRCVVTLAVVALFVLALSPHDVHSANGDLDFGFGIDGRVTTDFLGSNDFANAVIVQPDGRIAVAGAPVGEAYSPKSMISRWRALTRMACLIQPSASAAK